MDPTGRIDILLDGIIARMASRDPVLSALYSTFQPQIQCWLKRFDSPSVRRTVRSMNPKPKRVRAPRTGVVKAKVVKAEKRKQDNVIDAEWVAV